MTEFEHRATAPAVFGCGLAKCAVNCGDPFERIFVQPAPRGGAAIHWQLKRSFSDARPHSAQLQVSQGGTPTATDWTDVGLPVEDACYAVDPERRDDGFAISASYRVRLTTPQGIYYSDPTGPADMLPAKLWRMARRALQEKRQAMQRRGWDPGWLIKRNNSSSPCPDCTDSSGMSTNSQCATCYGTGRECPYWYPIPCVYANLQLAPYRKDLSHGDRGSEFDQLFVSEMVMAPLVDPKDVWVSSISGIRYEIARQPQPLVAIQGVQISARVKLVPLDVTDVAYTLEIEDPLDDVYGN